MTDDEWQQARTDGAREERARWEQAGVDDREAFVTEMFLHFTYQVAAFGNDPALVQRAAEFHYQFGRHIPTPQPGGCRECRS
jgi:hypothetical protein